MNKIVITTVEVKRAIEASGRRLTTGRRRRKIAAQLKATKMSGQE